MLLPLTTGDIFAPIGTNTRVDSRNNDLGFDAYTNSKKKNNKKKKTKKTEYYTHLCNM